MAHPRPLSGRVGHRPGLLNPSPVLFAVKPTAGAVLTARRSSRAHCPQLCERTATCWAAQEDELLPLMSGQNKQTRDVPGPRWVHVLRTADATLWLPRRSMATLPGRGRGDTAEETLWQAGKETARPHCL